MDSHPETDLDAAMSNPEEAEDRTAVSQQQHPHPHQDLPPPPQRFESEEEEEDDDEELDEEEDEVSGMSQLHVSGPDPTEEMILAQLRQEQERKLLERELLAQKELMIKREEYLPSPGRPGSKSPSSPPGTQYLYAAGHPFAAAAAAFLTPAHMAAAAAAAQAAAAAASAAAPQQQQQPHSLSSSSTGSATPPVNGIGLASPRGGDPDQSKYTYEEQFKQEYFYDEKMRKYEEMHRKLELHNLKGQLYELSDDPRRKSFLDDLFSYMQKRGTPVTRIPIMAKQVLDLYELYRLVVARGGLVEVINKKIWREITKGLNLPSSITSAAFTLRTQYMKYLYAYECDKEKLSSAEELQAAIDGNRREGRRSSYGTYADVVPGGRNHPPPLNSPLSLVSRHMNGHGSNPGGRGSSSPLQLAYYPPHSSAPLNLASSHENGIYGNHALSSGFVQFGVVPPPESYSNSTKDFSKVPSPEFDQNNSPKDLSKDSSYKNGRRSSEDDNCNSVPSTPNPLAMPQEQALNLEVSRNNSSSTTATNNGGADHKPPLNLGLLRDADSHHNSSSKRPKIEEDRLSRSGMPSTHIKITSNRGPDGRTQSDGSLMVSMEVNGIMYQGVLFAAPNHRNRL